MKCLYNKDGYYNTAGELLADENDIDFSGIDIVKFGKDINKILYRKTISNVSLLTQFDSAVDFRESLANAIVHRVWDTNSYIQIEMYEDKIEINPPRGLPAGISKDEYLNGNISVLRNHRLI